MTAPVEDRIARLEAELRSELAGCKAELARCQARIAQLEAERGEQPSTAADALMDLPDDHRLYSADLARVLGCSVRSIQRRVKAGKIPQPAWEGGKRVWLAGAVKDRYREQQELAALRNRRRPGWSMN